MRKIVQIQASTIPSGASAVWALCDDGTLWGLSSANDVWVRLTAIPQDAHQTSKDAL